MRMKDQVVEAIRRHAAGTYPEECCGVLVGSAGEEIIVAEAIAVENVDDADRSRRYTIGADTLLRITRDAARRDLDVVGFYHSHPDHPARPSETDLREATFPHYVYVIQSVDRGVPTEMTAWSLAQDRSSFVAVEVEAETHTKPKHSANEYINR